MLQKPELSAGLMGHLARMQTLPTLPLVLFVAFVAEIIGQLLSICASCCR